MPFPSVFSTFNRPTTTDRLNSPSHSGLHNTVSSAIGQLEAVIGTDASTLGTIIGDLRSASSGGGGHVQAANKGGTGQTTYTKGDILVAQSSSVLTKLSAGTDGTALIADSTTATGMRYGTVGVVTTSVITGTSVVWTKPAGITTVVVEMWSGGGSGGSRQNSGFSIGGGGGAYLTATFPASSVPQAVSVIAAASVIGVSGNANGNNGKNSYFGSLLTVGGAVGGAGSASTTIPGAQGGSVLGFPTSILYGMAGGSGGGGGAITPVNALYSSGSGGVDSSPNIGNSGNTIYGGGAGSSVGSTLGAQTIASAGTSFRGGNGGLSVVANAASIAGTNGATPGGGGGGTIGATSGSGGPGQVIIYTF